MKSIERWPQASCSLPWIRYGDSFKRDTRESIPYTAFATVLQRCKAQQLYVKLAKCTFCFTELMCLGDIISRDGVRVDPSKVAVISKWPEPRTKRNLQTFIGTCAYLLRFCPDFAALVAPLTEATKSKRPNDKVELSQQQFAAFSSLKERLTTAPTLAHPNSRCFFTSRWMQVIMQLVDTFSSKQMMEENLQLRMKGANLQQLKQLIRLVKRNRWPRCMLCVFGRSFLLISRSSSIPIIILLNHC